jgi:SAM-dependent methyltransferase
MPETSHRNNQNTVADYERTARDYVDTVDGKPSASDEALRRLAAAVTPGSRVLEIGSGPGWDADRLEALGVDVHRTDAATAFCDYQAERGRHCDRLDLLSDRIDKRYAGVLMLCVLQHFERAELDGALRKLASVLDAGGPMLLMYPEGEDERWEHGAEGDYRIVLWTPTAFHARLAATGFAVAWETTIQGRGGAWRTVVATRVTP